MVTSLAMQQSMLLQRNLVYTGIASARLYHLGFETAPFADSSSGGL